MIEVLEIAMIGRIEPVTSVVVVLDIGRTVLCMMKPEFDGKGRGAAKITKLVENSCLNGRLGRFRIFGT